MPDPEVIEQDLVRLLLLVRHAEREREGGERAPLTRLGRRQAETLGSMFNSVLSLRPEAILCSRSSHAREHADIVSRQITQGVIVIPVTALTPHTSDTDFTVAGMLHEAGKQLDLNRLRVVACVGHEPRLGQLAQAMTGEKPSDLGHAEIQCVEGDSWRALEEGHGRLAARLSAEPKTQGVETDLLPKIQSKMQTSALLAGFTSTVFGVVLTESDYWIPWANGMNWSSGVQAWKAAAPAAGLVCLALATLLFVVSIYMYDRLAMPRATGILARARKVRAKTCGRVFGVTGSDMVCSTPTWYGCGALCLASQ
jgi:phosphohistidine phosphatase SixA